MAAFGISTKTMKELNASVLPGAGTSGGSQGISAFPQEQLWSVNSRCSLGRRAESSPCAWSSSGTISCVQVAPGKLPSLALKQKWTSHPKLWKKRFRKLRALPTDLTNVSHQTSSKMAASFLPTWAGVGERLSAAGTVSPHPVGNFG